MNQTLWPLFLACLWTACAGCSKSEYSGPERFPLAGKVTFEGEPVDAGTISFLPADASGEQRVSGGTIVDGTYSVPEAQGANAGKHRIEIRWMKRTGKQVRDPISSEMIDQRVEGLPAKYHTDSALTTDVPSPTGTYDFDLKKK